MDREEGAQWASAAEDVDSVEEMRDIHEVFEERDAWPG
jgi:hypothetical protein